MFYFNFILTTDRDGNRRLTVLMGVCTSRSSNLNELLKTSFSSRKIQNCLAPELNKAIIMLVFLNQSLRLHEYSSTVEAA